MPTAYDFIPIMTNSDFLIGTDDFNDLSINPMQQADMYWFSNRKKGLIKRFVLRRTDQIEKSVQVTLAKTADNKYSPRFDFSIYDVTKKSLKEYSSDDVDVTKIKIKAKVNLSDCYNEFNQLLSYMASLTDIDMDKISYKAVTEDYLQNLEKSLEVLSKDEVIVALSEKYKDKITTNDIDLLLDRKNTLNVFHRLLNDKVYFEKMRLKMGENTRREDVWQKFFEINQWIFGYGLSLVSTESLSETKLEQVTTGANIFNGAGKRVDGLLRTRAYISSLVFCEIKTDTTELLSVTPYRKPNVYKPSSEIVGGVSQVQKTSYKAMLKMTKEFEKVYSSDGSSTGIEYSTIKPKQILVAGNLDQLTSNGEINVEMLSSFELYRKTHIDVEIITFDELYARAKYIVEGTY